MVHRAQSACNEARVSRKIEDLKHAGSERAAAAPKANTLEAGQAGSEAARIVRAPSELPLAPSSSLHVTDTGCACAAAARPSRSAATWSRRMCRALTPAPTRTWKWRA